ncbi:hypothetical protein ACFWY5_45750 [Nonomuraea sp. NPDC059007]|uniref:hypothetical protein n=1 Tax=Nonomuraea sp. NPDC059007 TaxID=3346692 RepID=UPI0036CC1E93
MSVGGHNYGTIVTGGQHSPPPPLARALAGLPAEPPDFTGRGESLALLQDALCSRRAGAGTAGSGGTAVVVSTVAGMAGVGKTALALVAAHHARRKGWFAGGVFFLDLHGYTPGAGEPVKAGTAAGQLLRAMGLRGEELPPTGEELLAVYRSVLASLGDQGRGVLVVADNAVSVGQVQPLVPAHGCHRLLVTSRHTLALAGRRLDLDVLDADEAVQLLRAALTVRVSDARVEREPQAALGLVGLYGRLPLAVQIIAAMMAAEPDRPLSAMVGELAEAGQRLDVLQPPGHEGEMDRPHAVRAAFALSYRRLADRHPARVSAASAAAVGSRPRHLHPRGRRPGRPPGSGGAAGSARARPRPSGHPGSGRALGHARPDAPVRRRAGRPDPRPGRAAAGG